MSIEKKYLFDTDLNTLFSALSSTKYLGHKYDETGIKRHEFLKDETTADQQIIDVRIWASTNMPKIAQKIIPAEVALVGTVIWFLGDGKEKKGRYITRFEKFPVEIVTEVVLKEEGKGKSSYKTITTAKCSIPMIGEHIAPFIEKDTSKMLDQEEPMLKEYLKTLTA